MTASHRRHNPLTDEWVLVSPNRTKRPWHGQVETISAPVPVRYDDSCHLCPSNGRQGGSVNPAYESTFVFDNDYPSLRSHSEYGFTNEGLLQSRSETGSCRVICYSPRHDLRMSLMSSDEVATVIEAWRDESRVLGARHTWVQIFENNGEMMGASSPHPHGQVWATDALPTIPSREDLAQLSHWETHGTPLLLDYVAQEVGDERIVVDGGEWLAIVPFWATWPFETLIVPSEPVQRMTDVRGRSQTSLANVLTEVLARYDNLFETPFPYSMGWHGAPFGVASVDHWQLHAHIYPPLLRSAAIRKFMVGYELLGEPQRDVSAEDAAARLRSLSPTHYSERPTR